MSGNWKMNLNHFEAIQLVQKLNYQLDSDDYDVVEVTLHPSFTNIRSIQTLLDADNIPIQLGAQNCHWDDSGAWTGEQVNAKVKSIFKHEMTPILAFGETQEERDAGQTEEKVVGQLEACLAGVGGPKVAEMVLAYEPIWAIGTGLTATPADAQDVCKLVRDTVQKLKGKDAAKMRGLRQAKQQLSQRGLPSKGILRAITSCRGHAVDSFAYQRHLGDRPDRARAFAQWSWWRS